MVGRVAAGEALVLVGREPAAVDAEAAAQLDAHRLGGGGPVERRGDRGAPVDDDRVAVVVADVPAPDVEGLLAVLGAHVDPAEEQVVRGSSCSEATRRASTRPSSSLVQASVALAASSRSVASRIRRSSVAGVVEVGLLAGEHLVGGGGVGGGWVVSAVGAGTAEPPLWSGWVRILANR